MAFQIDVTSINSAAQRLAVIGNNISNASSAGFKGANFSDVLMASSVGATGTKEAGSRQSFTQGNITANSNPLDMAINGNGLFRIVSKHSTTPSYTRDGQFQLDKLGNIVNATGDQLTGFAADANGKLLTGAAVPLHIDTSPYKPVMTKNATLELTLDASQPYLTSNLFDPVDAGSYTSSTTTTVYDAGGSAHDMQTYYIKTSATSWDVFGSDTSDQAGPLKLGSLVFDSSGQLDATNSTNGGKLSIPIATGGVSDASSPLVSFDLSSSVQYGTSFAATMSQDGSPPGAMTGYRIGPDGVITASYDNGAKAVMGQVVLAGFKNMGGLAPTENNQWRETSASGSVALNTAGAGGMGMIQASATEDANVDLTGEMIKMISAQRLFQADAELVKKQDEVMQTVVQIGQ